MAMGLFDFIPPRGRIHSDAAAPLGCSSLLLIIVINDKRRAMVHLPLVATSIAAAATTAGLAPTEAFAFAPPSYSFPNLTSKKDVFVASSKHIINANQSFRSVLPRDASLGWNNPSGEYCATRKRPYHHTSYANTFCVRLHLSSSNGRAERMDSADDNEEDDDEFDDDDEYDFDDIDLDLAASLGDDPDLVLSAADYRQQEMLDELDLAEEMGLLDDDEFLLAVDDDFIVLSRRVDSLDDGVEGDLAGGFEEDGKEYRNIDDDTLLEILGLPDEDAGLDVPERDARKISRFFDEQLREKQEAAVAAKMVSSSNDDGRSTSNTSSSSFSTSNAPPQPFSFQPLENALAQGVVPTEAGVGSGALPGDFGFDPLELSTKDYFKQMQRSLLSILPGDPKLEEDQLEQEEEKEMVDRGYDGGALPKKMRNIDDLDVRPQSLIIRDYREAEIRHGRLAMLAAIFWPLQELVDRWVIPETFGRTTFVYGGPTLPFFPLLMTFIMLNLGYLDIFASEVKKDEAGDAFLPGECFWDPLKMLDGAPDDMKRNMQQRELFNGRIAMLAVACFIFDEAVTHKPLITGRISQYLFEPFFEVPSIQAYLDSIFGGGTSPVFMEPDGPVNYVDALKQALEEEADKVIEEELSEASTASDAAAGAASSGMQNQLEPYSMRFSR